MYLHTPTLTQASEQDIRDLFPNVSFPAVFEPPADYMPVVLTPPPAYDHLVDDVQPAAPVFSQGQWHQQWEVVALAPSIAAGNLAIAKDAKNLEIDEARASANQTFFVYGGKQISCNSLSRSDIDAINGSVALNGTMPPNWPGAWKAIDKSFVLIPDVATWKAFYAAMVDQGMANFAHSQALKTQLAAATTAAQIAAVTW